MKRSGSADLPLHGGRVPAWLARRMESLGRAITQVIVDEYGTEGFLTRISDPFWFQSLGAALGMDWHSSGITTSVMGALKRSLNPAASELGIYICGGRGKHSRKTPAELLHIAEQTGLNGDDLVHTSRLAAKVDNTLIQDGFQLYLHSFILTRDGQWAIVQQGMHQQNGLARRYHWLSSQVESFVLDPHSAIEGRHQGVLLNLSDSRAEPAQQAIVDFIGHSPDRQIAELRHLVMDRQHEVMNKHVNSSRLAATLLLAHENHYQDFIPLLLQKGVGPRTIQSLALVSELVYGKATRFDDPARFSFAHGGKDGHPFPVLTSTYDETIASMNEVIDKTHIHAAEKRAAFKSLSRLTRFIEQSVKPSVDTQAVIQWERENAHKHGARTVFDASRTEHPEKHGQLSLF
jgi:hypothetical protein